MLFEELERINARPEPFSVNTTEALWTDEHTSAQMLRFHLDGKTDLSSRNAAFIDRSAAWIGSRFQVGAGTRIADFGCGPGLYTTRLARQGAAVTGVDFSVRSIDHARQEAAREGLSIRYVQQDYLDFESEDRFDLVLLIMCDFCALGPTQRKRLLDRFFAVLKPGGHVVLDVYSLAGFAGREEQATYAANLLDGFWSPRPYYGFLNTFKYDAEKVVLDKYTIVEADRVRRVYNWLQYFSPDDLERELVECGFAVVERPGDVAGGRYDPQSSEMAVVALRP